MAEKLKEWQSSIIWVIGLVFICGMTYKTVSSMDSRVAVNSVDIKENRELIHKNQLVQTEINTKLRDIPEIKRDMEKLTEYIMQWEFKDKNKEGQ